MTDATLRSSADEHDAVTTRTTSAAASPNSDNVVDLLRTLVGQGTHLADQQLQLIKAEVRESTGDIKSAVSGFAGAAVVGISGLGVTLMGLAYLLAQAIDDLALATLIVGLVTLAIGYLMSRKAVSSLSKASLSPERSERTLQRTPDALRGDL